MDDNAHSTTSVFLFGANQKEYTFLYFSFFERCDTIIIAVILMMTMSTFSTRVTVLESKRLFFYLKWEWDAETRRQLKENGHIPPGMDAIL